MRIPNQWNYEHFARGLGLFLAGSIIGSAIFMSIYQHNLDLVITEVRQLRDAKEQLTADNESLKKYKNRQNIISVIQVHLLQNERNPLSSDVVSELEVRVKNDLKVVIGQKSAASLQTIELFKQLITKKSYFGVNDRNYTVSVKTVILLQNELTFWITAEPFIAPAPANSAN